jgi:hypothetical protein
LVNGFAQRFARFEVWNPLFWHGNAGAAARVAALAGRTPVHGKAAEATDLDPVSAHQRVIHGIQDGLHRGFCVALGQLVELAG